MALNLNVCVCVCVLVLVLVHIRVESSALHEAFELSECNFGLQTKLTIFQMFEKLQLNPNNTLIQMLTQNEMKRYKFIISLLPFFFFSSFPCALYGLLTAFWFCLRLQHPQYINQKHTNPWSIDGFCTYFDFVFWRFIFLFHSPLMSDPFCPILIECVHLVKFICFAINTVRYFAIFRSLRLFSAITTIFIVLTDFHHTDHSHP